MRNEDEMLEKNSFFEWAENIEKKRKRFKISQSRFCSCIGIAESYYRFLLKGKKPLTEEMRERIEQTLERLNPDNPLSLVIDYVRIRFPVSVMVDFKTICNEVLQIPAEGFQLNGHGWNNYEQLFAFGNIFVCASDNDELGVLLELKGSGCRQYETHLAYKKQTWFDFFNRCLNYDAVFKRIDLAVNDHYGILDIQHLIDICKMGGCIGKNRKWSQAASGELAFEKPGMGYTLYIGTRQSETYFCIYEKDYEQMDVLERNGIEFEDAPIKNRFEIRLADERAAECINQLIKHRYDDDGIETVVFGIINHYLRFTVPPKSNVKGDKREWELDVMWEHFIGGYRDKIRLAMEPKPFSRIRTLNWLSRQCMPTIKGMLMDDVNTGDDTIVKMINEAKPGYKLSKILGLEKEMYDTIKVDLDEKGRMIVC